jgi:hypothetical protein
MAVGGVLTTASGAPAWGAAATIIAANAPVLMGPAGGVPTWGLANDAIAGSVAVLTVSSALLPSWQILGTPPTGLNGPSSITTIDGQIWVLTFDGILRLAIDGTAIAPPLTYDFLATSWLIRTIGDTVWCLSYADNSIVIMDVSGTVVGDPLTFDVNTIQDFSAVDSEVWLSVLLTSDASSGAILRINPDGSSAGPTITDVGDDSQLAVGYLGMAGSDVWFGGDINSYIVRILLDGEIETGYVYNSNYLINNARYQTLKLVVDHIWSLNNWEGNEYEGYLDRFSLDGTLIDTQSVMPKPSGVYDFCYVGDSQVWLPSWTRNEIVRLNLDGTSAGAPIS